MTEDIFNLILAYSCSLPAIAGIVFYKRMEKTFHPFIWAMWLSLITETMSRFVFTYASYPIANIGQIHLYYIFHYFFFLLFFKRQDIITSKQLKYLLLAGVFIFVLNCLFKPIFANLLGEKTIAFYLVIFILSVKLLGEQIFNITVPIFKNALFFIACGLLLLAFPILQNTIRIVVRYFYDLSSSKITALQHIFEIANAISYLLFFGATINIAKNKTHK